MSNIKWLFTNNVIRWKREEKAELLTCLLAKIFGYFVVAAPGFIAQPRESAATSRKTYRRCLKIAWHWKDCVAMEKLRMEMESRPFYVKMSGIICISCFFESLPHVSQIP
jgi:hypothetical protein